MSTFTISVSIPAKTISIMKHFVGLDKKNPDKNGKYAAYRNYFVGKESSPYWDFMEKHQLIKKVGDNFYRLTLGGVYCLQAYLGIKISFMYKEDYPKGWEDIEE